MVLDLHKTYGYVFDKPAESINFFYDEALQKRFYKIWEKLITRYAKDSDIIMFEPLNEVVSPDVINEWNDISSNCINIIRSKAPNAKILLGGVCYNAVTTIKHLPHTDDENIVYNFHCYEPMLFTHQSAYWVDGMPEDFHIEYPGDWNKYVTESKKYQDVLTEHLLMKALGFTLSVRNFLKQCFLMESRQLKKETALCTVASMESSTELLLTALLTGTRISTLYSRSTVSVVPHGIIKKKTMVSRVSTTHRSSMSS